MSDVRHGQWQLATGSASECWLWLRRVCVGNWQSWLWQVLMLGLLLLLCLWQATCCFYCVAVAVAATNIARQDAADTSPQRVNNMSQKSTPIGHNSVHKSQSPRRSCRQRERGIVREGEGERKTDKKTWTNWMHLRGCCSPRIFCCQLPPCGNCISFFSCSSWLGNLFALWFGFHVQRLWRCRVNVSLFIVASRKGFAAQNKSQLMRPLLRPVEFSSCISSSLFSPPSSFCLSLCGLQLSWFSVPPSSTPATPVSY